MVKRKGESQGFESGWLDELLDKYDKENPVVETWWAVDEVTPAYNTGGYYDQDIPEESHRVSPNWRDRGLAEAWIDKHEADEGKFLTLVKIEGRETRQIFWTTVRVAPEKKESAKSDKCPNEGRHMASGAVVMQGDVCKDCGWIL